MVKSPLPDGLAEKLRSLSPLAVALSGGVDSRFLCHAARIAGCDVIALHARGPHIPPEESAYACRWADKQNIPLLLVDFDPLALPGVDNNSRERCYSCKKELFSLFAATLGQYGTAGRTLCDGSNADDAKLYRPGQRALREARVRSPLAEAAFTKADIRATGAATGMEWAGQKARPCLLTRLEYGLAPNAAVLARLSAAEGALEAVLQEDGECDFRLRLTPAPLLQTTTPLPLKLRETARTILGQYGFAPCFLHVSKHVSGFFDAVKHAAREEWTLL